MERIPVSTTTSSTANTAADEEAKIATARKNTRSTSAKSGTTGQALSLIHI